ncbi:MULTISPECIES: HlyD family efflux transporter periplasmic adaptor subunit [unclassified Rhizobium]|uniref:efflux RND transporter periplasmic adaptor subunit n=1 Tax=unclassified Rhizobium TaxID=2613769 RepID=UPI000EA88829|nr:MULTISPECIES: HlyD family efflux transporter periplasmic adaptor subunit [unclassified Rhizobium]AYG69831.1 HlyD family efflux transporter periplasmic adaptor subunit [Rhizobium sp. CCGE531]AYG76206.1 HlyD family efflux transporter periplasmic adaptor subunit [Rhizobium sp. CCGE532]
MNTITEDNRKLAETLRSLSLEPSFQSVEPPPWKDRRLVPLSILLALGASVIAVTVFWPDIAPQLKGALQQKPDIALAPSITQTSGQASPTASQATASVNASIPALNPPQLAAVSEITGSGYVVAPSIVTVFSKYEGEIASVAAQIGDQVEAGQVLVGIDDISADFALEQAKADSDAAKLVLDGKILELKQAVSSLQRNAALSGKNVVSIQAVEEAQTARDTALNAVDQARQSYAKAQLGVRIAKEHVDALIVKAPISGRVTRLDAHVGGRVLARIDGIKESESLLTITDTKSLVIDADVAETNIGALRPGLRGDAVLDGFPDKPFIIEILQLWPTVSREKGTITLRLALIEPPEGIMPNMAARIRISTVPAQQPGGALQ